MKERIRGNVPYKKERVTWGFDPTTRVVKSKKEKAKERQRQKQKDIKVHKKYLERS